MFHLLSACGHFTGVGVYCDSNVMTRFKRHLNDRERFLLLTTTDSLRRGAISSVCTLYLYRHHI